MSEQSATFGLFHRAILERKQVTCLYKDNCREICPHILGHKDGDEKALVFQFGGRSASKLPTEGEWRCFYLKEVRNAAMREGPWRSSAQHRAPQSCVEEVYIDVNTDVPNQPGRR